jgi:hypothetical protein
MSLANRQASAVYNGGWTDRQIQSLPFRRKRRIKMFGKVKGNSHENDRLLPQAPQLQNLTPASLAESDSTEISTVLGAGEGSGSEVSGRGKHRLMFSMAREPPSIRVPIVRCPTKPRSSQAD